MRDRANPKARERLRQAIELDIDWLRILRKITLSALEWQKNSNGPDHLLSGDALDAAEKWKGSSTSSRVEVPIIVNEFLTKSRARQELAEEHEFRRVAVARKTPRSSFSFVFLLLLAIQSFLFLLTLGNSLNAELRLRLQAARISALALEAAPARMVSAELSDHLLMISGVLGVAEIQEDMRVQLLPPKNLIRGRIDVLVLDEMGFLDRTEYSIMLMLDDSERLIVIRGPGDRLNVQMEVLTSSAPIRESVLSNFINALAINLAISVLAGFAIFFFLRIQVSRKLKLPSDTS